MRAPRSGDRLRATNQEPLYITRKNLSGGQNDRLGSDIIDESTLTVAYNVDLGVPGKLDKRPGIDLIANETGAATKALRAYYPTGAAARLYRVEATNVLKWTGSGNWSAALTSALTTGLDTTLIQGGESGENEVIFLQNGTDNPQRINSSDTFQDLGATATSPPKSLFNLYVNNRWWVLKNGFLYYSDAFSADYSGAFNAANGFRFSGYGDDKGLFAIRSDDSGSRFSIIAFMQNAILGLTPSATPAATDLPFVITTDHGAVDRKCIVQVGDDILYLAPDGIRSLKRTIQDHVQIGTSYPLSYPLREELDNIDWSHASKFHATFWKDKFFFFFVQAGGSNINRGWVYWPALDPEKVGRSWAVITGWTITSTAKFFVSGEEFLYGGSTDGKVYQMWVDGDDDNGTAISMQVETRNEDFEKPALYKYGGELEICASGVGNYDLTVSASIDDGSYTTLGTMNLSGNSPTLPVALPFDLASDNVIRQKFHLDSLGRFRRIKFKITQATTNTSDKIRIFEYSCTTFPEVYDSEER